MVWIRENWKFDPDIQLHLKNFNLYEIYKSPFLEFQHSYIGPKPDLDYESPDFELKSN